jgi:replicative DNA helicase
LALSDDQAADVFVSQIKDGAITDERLAIVVRELKKGIRGLTPMVTRILDVVKPDPQNLITTVMAEGGDPHHMSWMVKELNDRFAIRRAYQAWREGGKKFDEAGDCEEAAQVLLEAAGNVTGALDEVNETETSNGELLHDIIEGFERRHSGESDDLITTFPSLDACIGGLDAGDLVVVGGETSAGKTAFAVSLAIEAMKTGKSCAYFSAEMPPKQILERFLSSHSSFPLHLMRSGSPTRAEVVRLEEGAEAMNSLPISAINVAGWHSSQITAKASALNAQGKADLVVVDYLQLIAGNGDIREQEVASVSRSLKTLAQTIASPVLALTQLNQDGKVRESRAIAHDADFVFTLDLERRELGIDKNRHGERGVVIDLEWTGKYARWEDPKKRAS